MAQVLADERAAAREYVERVEGEVRERGLEVSSEVCTGAASRELVGLAQPGDLIVMATHGRGGMARWFLGSVAEEVARPPTGQPPRFVTAWAQAWCRWPAPDPITASEGEAERRADGPDWHVAACFDSASGSILFEKIGGTVHVAVGAGPARDR